MMTVDASQLLFLYFFAFDKDNNLFRENTFKCLWKLNHKMGEYKW